MPLERPETGRGASRLGRALGSARYETMLESPQKVTAPSHGDGSGALVGAKGNTTRRQDGRGEFVRGDLVVVSGVSLSVTGSGTPLDAGYDRGTAT